MDCFRRISSVIIFIVFHMLQLVYATTTAVIPLCKPGDPVENCTSAIVKSTESPRVSTVKVAKCAQQMSDYCLNGHCMYLVELDEHYCRCEMGYLGVRCASVDLVQKPAGEEYLALTIFLTSMLLIVAAVAALFAFKWYKLRKSTQPVQKYKEVSTQNL
ncbi:proepiregulin [Hyperolius riggenbachi]|uniref:proepiregulin n=1 Tax=Hyperolius riggenbachi TaxID=752182 RepID=UPI0035A39968